MERGDDHFFKDEELAKHLHNAYASLILRDIYASPAQWFYFRLS